MIAAGDTLISRLRVITSERDELALRLNYGGALSELNLPPTSLPPAAILFVHRFRDPKPALLDLKSTTSARSNLWRQAVAERLGSYAQTALRPANGLVSDSAESILFADKAEMMACLAQDWCAGLLGGRWWWRALLRNDYSFWTTWIHNPEYIPAAIAQLARSHTVTLFAAALTEQEARRLTERVIEVFALRGLQGIFEWAVLRAPTRDQSEQTNTKQVSRRADVDGHAPQAPAPWHGVLQEAAAVSLPPPQQLFVGLALMIHQAPSLVRTARFALDVARWHRQQFETELKLTRAGKTDAQAMSSNTSRAQDLAPVDDRTTPFEIQSNDYQRERALEFALIEQRQNSVVPTERVTVTEREVHELSESELFSGEPHGPGAESLVQDP